MTALGAALLLAHPLAAATLDPRQFADDVTLDGNTYEKVAVGAHPGNGFELWNVADFRVTRTTVRGRLGGSAIDLYGARDGTVDGFTPQTIGFQISLDSVNGRPSDDWRQQGPVTLEGCRALANDVGLLIRTDGDLITDMVVDDACRGGDPATPTP